MSPLMDPQGASSSRLRARVGNFNIGIDDVLQDLNIPLDLLKESIEPGGETIRNSLEVQRVVEPTVPSLKEVMMRERVREIMVTLLPSWVAFLRHI